MVVTPYNLSERPPPHVIFYPFGKLWLLVNVNAPFLQTAGQQAHPTVLQMASQKQRLSYPDGGLEDTPELSWWSEGTPHHSPDGGPEDTLDSYPTSTLFIAREKSGFSEREKN